MTPRHPIGYELAHELAHGRIPAWCPPLAVIRREAQRSADAGDRDDADLVSRIAGKLASLLGVP